MGIDSFCVAQPYTAGNANYQGTKWRFAVLFNGFSQANPVVEADNKHYKPGLMDFICLFSYTSTLWKFVGGLPIESGFYRMLNIPVPEIIKTGRV